MDGTMKADCQRCGTEFAAETMTWGRNTRTGEKAHGGGNGEWYGSNEGPGEYWPAEETEEYQIQVGGVGTFGLCPDCVQKRYEATQRAAEYMSDTPPDWFDPAYAGERWSEDY